MEFDNAVKKRKSVRKFGKKRAGWKAVLDSIEAANQGPFAENYNNLKFLIIESKEMIKKIAKSAEQDFINDAGIVVAVCSDDSHLERVYGERGRIYSRQQAGGAIQTFLLKIADLGLAACWIGAYADELIKENLNIPQHVQIEAIIPVGYEDSKHKEKKPEKKELENIIYWERWDNGRRPSLFEEPLHEEKGFRK